MDEHAYLFSVVQALEVVVRLSHALTGGVSLCVALVVPGKR